MRRTGQMYCDHVQIMSPGIVQNAIVKPHYFHPKYRTVPCRNYPLGACRFGDQCAYLHGQPPQSPPATVPSLSPADPTFSLSADEDDSNYVYAPSMSSESSLASPCSDFHIDTGHPDGESTCPPPPPCTPMSAYIPVQSPMARYSYHPDLISETESVAKTPSPAPSLLSASACPMSRKSVNYKTKPCKYYHSTGSCNKGDRCGFIHGTSTAPPRKLSEDKLRTPSPVDTPREFLSQRSTPTSRKKSVSSEEGSEKSNFYPVTWRVISGGVMMGGKREVCPEFFATTECRYGNDCRLSHPDPESDDVKFSPAPEYTDFGINYDLFSPLSPVSPVSPMYFNAPLEYKVHVPVMKAPRRARAKKVMRKLTIVPPQPASSSQRAYSAHTYLDGSTLLVREQPTDEAAADTVCDLDDSIDARTLVRPVSTPPTPMRQNTEVIRLFAAEAP